MDIDKNTSERLAVLRFPLILGVVFIHAYGTDVALSTGLVGLNSQGFVAGFVQDLISQGAARIAVPLFFLISGFFFFLNFSFSLESFFKKVRVRIRTLLLPFLFWNILLLFLLALAQFIPITQKYFSGENAAIVSFGVHEYADAIFGLNDMPIAYQFWFIRDLMVMVLLAPLVYLIIRNKPVFFLVLLFLCWFFNYWPVYIPSAVAFFFFYLGGVLAYYKVNLFLLDRFGMIILFSYLAVLVISTLSQSYEVNGVLHKLGIILGILVALYLSKVMVEIKKVKLVLLWCGGCSFFIFAVHEPLLTVFKKLVYSIYIPSTDVDVLFLYFTIPILVVILSIFFYLFLKNIAPRVLSMISGGR